MACDRKTQLLISCYADGETTADETVLAEQHLHACADCRKLVEEWQGQRQLLQWACTFELPDDLKLEDAQMTTARNVNRPVWPRLRLRLNWLTAGALAAAIVMAFFAVWYAMLPSVLRVGGKIASGRASKIVRIGLNVRLRIGPGSKLVRVNDRAVRLDRGWVFATVEHGCGVFRVVTSRIEVIDQGTKFWVDTSPKMDSVVVREGTVLVERNGVRRPVKRSQMLLALDNGEASAVILPASRPNDTTVSYSIGDRKKDTAPRTADALELEDGLCGLARRFPKATRCATASASGSFQNGRSRMRYAIVPAGGPLNVACLSDTAYAISSRAAPDWEFPVCYLMTDNIVDPQTIPAGVYYVRMIARHGEMMWRLSDAGGRDYDLPLLWRQASECSGQSITGRVSVQYDVIPDNFSIKPTYIFLSLADWPGKLKPSLKLSVESTQASIAMGAESRIVQSMTSAVSRVPGFQSSLPICDVVYLDSTRRRRVAITWNDDAGNQLAHLAKSAKAGHRGKVWLGVVATDARVTSPSLGPGTYLIQLSWGGREGTLGLRLISPDALDSSGHTLQRVKKMQSVPISSYSSLVTPKGGPILSACYGVGKAGRNGFALGLGLTGVPYQMRHGDHHLQITSDESWVGGSVKISDD